MRTGPATTPDVVARAALRARCDHIHIVTVACDHRGRVLDDVTKDHPAGVLLAEPQISRSVEDIASGLSPDPKTPREVAKGCWAWIVTAETRLSSQSLVALALESGAVKEAWLLQAMTQSPKSSDRARARIMQAARYDPSVIKALAVLLSGSLEDLHTLAETRAAIRGFTRELSGSYETINLLYSLGRGMGDVTHPLDFARVACDKLLDAMPFSWAIVRLSPTPALPPACQNRVFASGSLPVAREWLVERSDEVVRSLPSTQGCVVLDRPADLCAGGAEPLFLAHPIVRDRQVTGAIMVGGKVSDDPTFSSYDTQTLEAAAGYLSTFLSSAGLYADQQSLFLGTMRALSASIDAKDRYTQGHSERVAALSKAIALAMDLGPEAAERLHLAGLLHDVGKIGVPEAVLTKQGKLTDAEFDAIKLHPTIGHKILRGIPLLSDVLPAVLHHHERWDGRGYPDKIANESIPVYARIVAVADTFDAMSSNRSYRAALPRPQVLHELRRCAGSQLDPAAVSAFSTLDLAIYDELVKRHEVARASAA
jgi:HD-GYP domain-containing protein (c-di-GMP phosphodiesterase class II)